jgi:hypothetical protein
MVGGDNSYNKVCSASAAEKETLSSDSGPANSDFLTPVCGGEYHQVVTEGANFELKESDLRAAKKRNLLSSMKRG